MQHSLPTLSSVFIYFVQMCNKNINPLPIGYSSSISLNECISCCRSSLHRPRDALNLLTEK